MTLVELVVAMAILSLVSGAFLTLLSTAMRQTAPLNAQAQTIDELRNATATIARELRSAECLYAPAANGAASNVLRFTTFFGGGTSSYEVTYTATGTHLLRQVTGEPAVRMVSDALVNTSDAFEHLATPRRQVRIRLHVQTKAGGTIRDLSTTVAGRNAWKSC
jgi:type II secretory pathway pseudopilin PulG